MDEGTEPSPAFMSALVTEHFVLQGASSSTIGESAGRATIYLSSVSSGLVAIGFASTSQRALTALACTVLPTVFLLGCFTTVRLVDTSVENIVALRRIETIRNYYTSLAPRAAEYFPAAGATAPGTRGVQYGLWSILFTTASMISIVNSVLGGAATALIAALAATLPVVTATSLGVVVSTASLVASLAYQRRRLVPELRFNPPPVGRMNPESRDAGPADLV